MQIKVIILVGLLTFLVGCGSDKDAYTLEDERVDDMPRSGEITCGYQGNGLVCANETIQFKVNMYRMTGRYSIRVEGK